MTRRFMALSLAATVLPAMLAWAAAPIVVSQINRQFAVHDITINRGDVIRFSNNDEFIHHIYVQSPSFSFNSGEQPPGQNVDVRFPTPGTFEVRCEIHPKMDLTVTVR